MKKTLITLSTAVALTLSPLAPALAAPNTSTMTVRDAAGDVKYTAEPGFTPRATKAEVDILKARHRLEARELTSTLIMSELTASTFSPKTHVRWGLDGVATLPNGKTRDFSAFVENNGAKDSFFTYAHVGGKECGNVTFLLDATNNRAGLTIDFASCAPKGTKLRLRGATHGESSRRDAPGVVSYVPNFKDFTKFRTVTLS